MDDLMKAIQIFRKYGNPNNPTHCEHDVMHIMIDPELVTSSDLEELDKLGFYPDDEGLMVFKSFRFGSA